MKGRNQRKMIVYGLAIALLVTTVAYAVLQTTLNINGTVTRKGGSWNIHFENVSSVTKTGKATFSQQPTISSAGATLTFEAELVVPKDSVSFTVDVVNDGTIDATLNQVVLTGVSEAAANDVTYTATYADGTPIAVNDELKQNQTKTIKVTAVYNDVDSVSAEEVELDLGLTLIYVQADGTGSGTTGDNPPDGPSVGDTSLANAPDLYNNSLTPIVYDEAARTWKVADTSSTWYNYSEQMWANAVILNSGVTKNAGDPVNIETEVKATYVWIPRYEYRIVGQYGTHTNGTAGTQETPGEIEVNFISTTQTTATSGYHIHPAFTFGNTEESGIWVGKFETTGSATTPTILPDNTTLTNYHGDPGVHFKTSQKFATYLSNSSGIDAHMMKNSEWGAVAYLSQSRYGKYGNPDYTGIYKEVYPNNTYIWSGGFKTGHSYGTTLGSNHSFNTYESYPYDFEVSTYGNSFEGLGASTTGTIYGVYDMSGGALEAVMALYINEGNAGKTFISASSTSEDEGYYTNYSGFEDGWFDAEGNKKYYDAYTGTSNLDEDGDPCPISMSAACNGGMCYGHALSETTEWYFDNERNSYIKFVSPSHPFLLRGGNGDGSSNPGLFYTMAYDSSEYSNVSATFRSVLVRS